MKLETLSNTKLITVKMCFMNQSFYILSKYTMNTMNINI